MEIPNFPDINQQIQGLGDDPSPKELLELQMQMQAEARLFSTLQNVIKMRHDTSMNAIQNIRNAVR